MNECACCADTNARPHPSGFTLCPTCADLIDHQDDQ